MNTARYEHAQCRYDDQIFVFGGFSGGERDTAEKYDGRSWKNLPLMPLLVDSGACTNHLDKIFMGFVKVGVWIYFPKKKIYEQLHIRLNRKIDNMVFLSYGSAIYILPGSFPD
jgi:hypothetical protein